MIGARQFVGMVQNILSIHLVVELIEPEFRLVLRLAIQLDLKFPYLTRRCQAHRQSPLLSSLHRRYPASQVPLPLSDAQMVRHPVDAVRGARLPDHPEPPPLTQITFLACCAHYPGGPTGADGYSIARSRAGFFPVGSAFPALAPGRRPHCSFRGLLKLHTRYGLQGRSPT